MGNKTKKKFIVIQIDSLPYSLLKKFMKKGGCKTIRKLLKRGYHLQKYTCGVLSGTPFVQAGIMYGDNSMVPGFRFIDKREKRHINFANPNIIRRFETRHFRKKQGILEGGSSYSNHLSGHASRSILTMSTMTRTKGRLKRLSEMGRKSRCIGRSGRLRQKTN